MSHLKIFPALIFVLFVTAKTGLAFEITARDFQANGQIPAENTCDGKDISPEIRWTEPPEGTESFALVVVDHDAPSGEWIHWVIYNIPKQNRMMREWIPPEESSADGVKQGKNDFGRVGYNGPCPPPKDQAHRYHFKIYALDFVPEVSGKLTAAEFSDYMYGHILAEAEIVASYRRKS